MINPQSSAVPFVWTEIGRKPGKYVINAIKINAELFPNNRRYIVVSKEFAKKIKIEQCQIVYEEDLLESENSREFKNQPKEWKWSQSSYWTNTTKRFFVLEQFMITHSYEQIIHLESDTVLLENTFVSNLFKQKNWGVKFTKQDSSRGCASVFLVNSLEKLEKFNAFIIHNWSNSEETDMTLLSKFQKSIDSDAYLPSGNLIVSNTVFDAGTIGRFFLGGDARNHRVPLSRRGLSSSGKEFFDPAPFKIIAHNSSVFLEDSSGTRLALSCVHIHSKRIPKQLNSLLKNLVKESNSKRGFIWRAGYLDIEVLKERVESSFRRRILRDNISDPRYR
jgi:hypothetical protein